MSKSFREDLTGQRFGRLTVIEFVPNEKPSSYWKCLCDCGNVKIIQGAHLKRGYTVSCGCNRNEKIIEYSLRHNLHNTRIYHIWCGLKNRCFNINNKNYADYGGRGITVYDEWKNDFQKFYDWAMENGYSDELSIDRIDTNGNYKPTNCRWIDKKEQQRNKRSNVIVECNDKFLTLAEVSELLEINYDTIYARYKRGDRGARLCRPIEK